MEVSARPSQPKLRPSQTGLAPKLTIEKFADGPITLLKFVGTIDEGFDGKKTGRAITGETLVLDLGGVKKISSFGIREWVDFMGAVAQKTIVLIECAPKVVDQLNMVANFAGGGRVFSFYTPFRCDYCDSEHRVLLDVAKDWEAVKAMKLADRPCPSCKESMYFDEDGSTYFSYVLGQGQVTLAPDVIAFLAAKLDYRVGTIDAKLKVDKVIDGRITYLRLTGGLDNTFPRDKLAEGLEGVVIADVSGVTRVEPAGAAEWRSFIQQAAPLVEIVYLTGVPPVFLEKLCRVEDLGTKAQVVDFQLPYLCKACGNAGPRTIDVAEHRAVLKFATAPELACPNCKAAMQTTAAEAQMLALPGLPMPVIDTQLQHKLAELRMRKLERRLSGSIPPLATRAAEPEVRRGTGASVYALAGVVVVVLGAIAYVAIGKMSAKKDAGPLGLGSVTSKSADVRPAWIADDRPGHVKCAGDACVGVSQPLPSQEEAENEASDAAVEAIAARVAAKSPAARDAALAAFERDPQSSQAKRDVADGRHAVAKIFGLKADAHYYEVYDTSEGKRYVAFAEAKLSPTESAARAKRADQATTALGATVIDFPPELAWQFGKLDHGALVTKIAAGPLQELGLGEHYVVLGVNGKDVPDAATFAKLVTDDMAALADRGGTMRLRVQPESGEPREISTQIAGKQVPVVPTQGHPVNHPIEDHSTGVNIWDRTGGGKKTGRDDPTQ
ncbi:MAG: hypothetical protein QM831_23990 [Kofleriaceae bacterium]